MATLDLALRPSWVFETLRLWQPVTSVPILLEQAEDFTAQELDSLHSRRRVVYHIYRFFVDSRGRGPQRRTLTQNVWAAYCRGYREQTLAPAFLTHLVAAVDVARALGDTFREHSAPGTVITTADLRAHLGNHPAHDHIAGGAVGIWLRTLAHFRVLNLGERVGEYIVRRPLPVSGGLFPLLVYSWAQTRRVARVNPVRFAEDPILAYVDRCGFGHYWHMHAGYLWFAETATDTNDPDTNDPGTTTTDAHTDHPPQYWRLRYTDPGDFSRALINLLTTYRRPRRYALPRAASLTAPAAPD